MCGHSRARQWLGIQVNNHHSRGECISHHVCSYPLMLAAIVVVVTEAMPRECVVFATSKFAFHASHSAYPLIFLG